MTAKTERGWGRLVLGALAGLVALGAIVNNSTEQDFGAPEAKAGPPLPASAPPPGKNRLAREASLYLRQHGDNPLDWFPWGEEALAQARALDRPIFLSIGYASCHWCHVMEHEVFEDAEVAAFMNQRFISIKVDREERPDLDAVYMEAVQAMTGRGGWPMSVFLTPDGLPFFGGTYFPKEAFLQLADRIHHVFTTQRAGLERDGARLRAMISSDLETSTGAALARDDLSRIADQALARVDKEWGGFQSQQKFPTPLRWRFLLHRYRQSGEERYAEVVRRTLDQMGSGGIQDHVGGGFHRYTVEQTWLVPHFEKMLYDNAQLASLYVEASRALGASRYEEIARDTLDFMLRELRGDEGAFYASFDADSGGEEGSFYVWTPAEIEAVAGAQDGPALAALLGATTGGNFEGSNVLTRRADLKVLSARFELPLDELVGLLPRWREPLRQARSQRVAPTLDRKIVASWNGLAIEALARAALTFDEPRYLEAATRAADYLWRVHRREDDTLWRSSTAGRASNPAILDDYAFLAGGLLALFEASGDIEHLERASALVDLARERFAHADVGFYLTASGAEAPLGRKLEVLDSVEPSGNAAMLHNLLRLAALKGDDAYRQQAELMLRGHAELMDRAGLEMAGWLDAAELFIGPLYEMVLVGDAGARDTDALLQVFRELAPAHAVLVRAPAGGAGAELAAQLPPVQGKVAQQGSATAYVCERGACKAPTGDPEELRRQLLSGWAR